MEHLEDIRTFFTSTEKRKRILNKYAVSHVLLNKKLFPPEHSYTDQIFIPSLNEKLAGELSTLWDVILNIENFLLVKIRRDA